MGKVIIVTGAAGYVGRRIVFRAQQRGHKVKAVVRPGCDISNMPWARLYNIEVVEIDLASDLATAAMFEVMREEQNKSTVIIHAAGSMAGDDDVQYAQTIKPTQYLIDAMKQAGLRRLILLSSMSVYGYLALPENSQLDETTPTELYIRQRDAYCRAKLSQETIVLEAAQIHGFVVTALRPGAIIGAGRLWTPRLGFVKSTLGCQLGSSAKLPLSIVDHCADAVVLASEKYAVTSDVYVESFANGESGAFEAINVIDDDLPTQQQYILLLKKHTNVWPRAAIYFPWRLLKLLASCFAVFEMVWPGLLRKIPGILREATLHARIKPLCYSNARLHDRLGWSSTFSIEDVVKLSDRDSEKC